MNAGSAPRAHKRVSFPARFPIVFIGAGAAASPDNRVVLVGRKDGPLHKHDVAPSIVSQVAITAAAAANAVVPNYLRRATTTQRCGRSRAAQGA